MTDIDPQSIAREIADRAVEQFEIPGFVSPGTKAAIENAVKQTAEIVANTLLEDDRFVLYTKAQHDRAYERIERIAELEHKLNNPDYVLVERGALREIWVLLGGGSFVVARAKLEQIMLNASEGEQNG